MKSASDQVKFGDQFLIQCVDNDESVVGWFVGSGIYRLITDIGGIPWTIQSKNGKTGGPVSSSDSFLLSSSLLPTAPLYLRAAEKSFFDLTYDPEISSNNFSHDYYFSLDEAHPSNSARSKHLTYDCKFQIKTAEGKSGGDGQRFWLVSDGIIVSNKGSGSNWKFEKVK
ncbi:MAG: hypothetical protein QOH33_1153 [Paraburkholderia sp.]|nr:hypothetical protein [Paraburkholderia sp.]